MSSSLAIFSSLITTGEKGLKPVTLLSGMLMLEDGTSPHPYPGEALDGN